MYFVRDIQKAFGDNHVLRAVSLDIEAHKTTVLIGPSGAADFSMRVFNADGGEAEMCGNAARCVGK